MRRLSLLFSAALLAAGCGQSSTTGEPNANLPAAPPDFVQSGGGSGMGVSMGGPGYPGMEKKAEPAAEATEPPSSDVDVTAREPETTPAAEGETSPAETPAPEATAPAEGETAPPAETPAAETAPAETAPPAESPAPSEAPPAETPAPAPNR